MPENIKYMTKAEVLKEFEFVKRKVNKKEYKMLEDIYMKIYKQFNDVYVKQILNENYLF